MKENTILTLENYCMNICFIAGPSGQGKSHLESMLLSNKGKHNITYDEKNKPAVINFRKIIQCTTRRKRPNETFNPISSYLFVNKEKYDEMNNSGILFGRTSIEYKNKDRNSTYTDYYGSIIPINDIVKAYYKEKFYGEKTIFTVILNAKGIQDFLEFLNTDFIKLEKDGIVINGLSFNLFGINVDGNNGLERKGRNKNYVNNERKSLIDYDDYFTFRFFNDFKENNTITKEDVDDLVFKMYDFLNENPN